MTGGRIKRIKEYVGEEPFMLTYGDADNRQKKFDAKDKSDNEYQPGHKNDKNKKPDGKVIIKGHEYQNVDFDVRI